MTVTFRPATADDADAVHAVTQLAYGTGPPLDPPSGALREVVPDVRRDLVDCGGVLAIEDDRPVASLRFRFDGPTAWLRRVGVVPELWRHSYGTRLVAYAHALLATRRNLAELRVGVRTARPGARRFWESMSYELDSEVDSAHNHWVELRRAVPAACIATTAADTHVLGARLAELLRAGDLIVCIGGLGAGKTTFAQGVGAGLGVSGVVTSPTFVLARCHPPGRRGLPFVHADAYRLGAVTDPLGELDALDLDATLDEAVTLVEWGEGLAERLAVNRVEVRIETADGESRLVIIDPLGPRWAGIDVRAPLASMLAS